MHINLVSSAVAAAALLPMAALAASPSYNHIDVVYTSADLDDGPTVDGFGVGGSFALSDRFHAVASYTELTEGPLEANTIFVALGYNTPLTATTDFVARAGWLRGELEFFGSETDNGWGADFGVRSMFTENLELNAFVTHVDIFDGDDTSLNFGVAYYLTDMLGVVGGMSFADDATGYEIGLRIRF